MDADRTLEVLLKLKADTAEATAQLNGALKEVQVQAAETGEAVAKINAGGLPGDDFIGPQLEQEVALRTRALELQTQHGLTGENALRLAQRELQTREALAEQAAKENASLSEAKEEISESVDAGASLGGVIFVAASAAYGLYKIISEVGEEIAHMNDDLLKASAELDTQVTKWVAVAKGAGDFGDVVNLGDQVATGLDAAAVKFEEFRKRELTLWQVFKGEVAGLVTFSPEGQLQTELEEAKRAQQELFATRLRDSVALYEAAQASAAIWNAIQTKPYADGLQDIYEQIDKLRKAKADLEARSVPPPFATPEQLLASKQAFDQLAANNRELQLWEQRAEQVTGAHGKLTAEIARTGDELAKVDFKQLDRGEVLAALNAKAAELKAQLHAMGIEAATPNEALAKMIGLTDQEQSAVLGIASAWGNVIGQIGRAVAEAAKLAGQQKEMADKLALTDAYAYGTRDEIYKAEWGAKYNKILAEREKIGADTSGKAINDQIYAEELGEKRKKQIAEEDRATAKIGSNQKAITEATREQANLLADIRAKQQLVQGNPFMGADEKQAATARLIRQEVTALNEQLARDVQLQKQVTEAGQWQQLQGRIIQVRTQIALLGQTLQRTQSFGGRLRADLTAYVNQWGTSSQQISGFITGSMGAALNSFNQMLVTGKFNATALLQQIAMMGLQMLEQMALQRIMAAINHSASVAEAEVTGTATAAALAPAATAATIASYGAAAYEAPFAIAGALAASMGVLVAHEGGPVDSLGEYRGGPLASDERMTVLRLGEVVVRKEVVDRAPGFFRDINSNVTRPNYSSASGSGARAGTPAAGVNRKSGSKGTQIRMINVLDMRAAAKEALKSFEGETIVIDHINNRRVSLGLPS